MQSAHDTIEYVPIRLCSSVRSFHGWPEALLPSMCFGSAFQSQALASLPPTPTRVSFAVSFNPVYLLSSFMSRRAMSTLPLSNEFGAPWHASATEHERQLIHSIADTKKEIERAREAWRQQEDHLNSELQSQEERLYVARAARAPITRISDDVLKLILEANAEQRVLGWEYTTKRKQKRWNSFQLVCSQVCSRWRRVAFNTSALWCSFTIADKRSLDHTLLLLGHIHCRFGLILALKCSRANRIQASLLRRLADAVSRYSTRLIRLAFFMCTHAVHHFAASLKSPLSSLRQFRYLEDWSDCANSDGDLRIWNGEYFQATPDLTRLEFTSVSLSADFVSIPSVTHLRLSQTHSRRSCVSGPWLCSFLSKLPNLQELRLADVDAEPDSGTSEIVVPRLDHLRLLKLAKGTSACATLFSEAVFPKLQHLLLEDLDQSTTKELVVSFIQRNHRSITHLSCILNESSWRDLLIRALPPLLQTIGSQESPDNPRFPGLIEICLQIEGSRGRVTSGGNRFSRDLALLVNSRLELGSPIRHLIVHPPLEQDHYDLIKDKIKVTMLPYYAPVLY
ncbi:hypothetical protein CALVIDRAFT_396324 [Calocera viscosa TUFC12733]|uniref:F-box domain-containing protein n=1 Tax=Calocera viscosa (strain TUFC12733) TaxID=1330018 RepID=A0A167GB55_CALVF|nr:hypothetical protein CALVIDRAFT_396324 [Calocera viscosa TUFC12733]